MLPVSRVTLGTMRLDGAGGEQQAARLLASARDMGVRSFHCSAEYGSYPLFAAAWARAGLAGGGAQEGAALIAKVASPHFGEDRFSPTQVRAKVDAYLQTLGVDRLDVVQWLLRHDLAHEEARLRILKDQTDEVADTVAALKREGKIAAFVGFPYTRPIADALVAAAWCDGLALYTNPLEQEMDAVIDACARENKPVVAIRPYAAGRVFAETGLTADQALGYVFAKPAVATVVVSCSSEQHLSALQPHLAARR